MAGPTQRAALDLAALFLEAVPRAMREIRTELRSSRDKEMSVPQFRILAVLGEGDVKTNKEISELIGVNVATMSRMVQALELQGLVEKESGRKDRREVSIKLSRRGRSVFEKIRLRARKGLSERLSSLSDTDRKSLRKGLEVLIDSTSTILNQTRS